MYWQNRTVGGLGKFSVVSVLSVHNSSLTTDYVLGTTGSPLEVVVQVANHGEDAFEAKVSITIPPGTSYVNVFNIQSVRRTIPSTSNEISENCHVISTDLYRNVFYVWCHTRYNLHMSIPLKKKLTLYIIIYVIL